MLKRITDVSEYMDFINEISGDPDFSDPMLQTREQLRCNLLEAPNRPENQVWGVFEKEEITGLFAFLVLEEEAYLEMLAGLSRVPKAYGEMLSFLKGKYGGCLIDFVYNPGNYPLHKLLQDENAEFETEQQKMVLKKIIPYQSKRQIALYKPEYREQYFSIHQDEGYWTAEKVIDAPEVFRVFLAIAGGEVVGYLDVTYCHDENEPYDLFVKEEYRRMGYGKAMLSKAIELNGSRGMTVLTDIDNAAAIALYESLGFVKMAGENNVTAHVRVR
ncbi:MAG: GNAT family N-acetyltransferase [Roseburia sp.]|nr:GNAT family N-acetyltransferase [Roseburia sp.]MCM1096602.1 GNAT family N-acetyltransferase [Ruminococcus flavefaciens]